MDLPLNGRRFDWSRLNGRTMSRLDRFLSSTSWCIVWDNFFQWVLNHGLFFYHTPLIKNDDWLNWDPRPFCIFKCWSDIVGYHEFVKENLSYVQVSGLGGYVLREKLLSIKNILKEWLKNDCSNPKE